MRITVFLMLAVILQTFANEAYSQKTKLSLDYTNTRLEVVLDEIEELSEFFFLANEKLVDLDRSVNLSVENKKIDEILDMLFAGTDVVYTITDRKIILAPSFLTEVAQQQRSVSGKVTDSGGQPLPGVTVVVKGTTQGTVTNADGDYTLSNVPEDATLVFSFLGMRTQEVVVGNQTSIDIRMEEESIGLEEVVAVGYGNQKKVNLTGSVAALKGADIAKRSTIQTSQALQGMAPGVTITSNSGRPGKEGTSVRIRGIGTVNNNDPLVLIDGVSSSLDAIDPNDIENISILKDAASAAIYGSRAANGVILITSKRGKTKNVNVTYKGSIGFSKAIEMPKNASAWDYMTLYDEANGNDLRNDNGETGGYVYGPELINEWKNATDRDAYPNTDMFRETFKTSAPQTKHYLGFSLGNDKLRSNTSINYTRQNAHFVHSYFERYGVRSNNNYTMNKFIEFGADLSIRNTKMQDASVGGISGLMRQPAIYQTRYSNGIWGTDYGDGIHIMQSVFDKLQMGYEDHQEIISKISTIVTPFEGMKINFSYAAIISKSNNKNTHKTAYVYDYKTELPRLGPIGPAQHFAHVTQTRQQTREDDININANYTKSFGSHDINVLGGYQYLANNYNYLSAYRQGNPFQQFEEINSFNPTGMTNSGYSNEWALLSYFGRFNYAYAGKYLFEGNIRYDGSSRFAKGHKWGLFPSFSGAWRFSAESFMDDLSWLYDGKLRASWGQLGNQEGLGSNYPFALNVNTNQYTVFGGTLHPGYAPVNYALHDITWESTEMIDVGLDLSLFNGKLDVNFDWYKKDTYDILLNIAIPAVMGYANTPKQNAGIIQNKGWDLMISHSNTKGDFYYKVTGVLSDVHNKIIEFGGLLPQTSEKGVNMVGYPIGSLYGLVADGLFSSFTEARNHPVSQYGRLQGGDIRYVDQLTVDTNGDGEFDAGDNKIDQDDRVVLGNPIPRMTYSMDFYVAYKDFDFSMYLQGVGRRDAYTYGYLAYPFENASTALVQHLDRWNEANPNPNAAYPRLSINQHSNNTQTSSFWVVDASYLRIKNVQLGYTLPSAILNKNIASVRIYVNAINPLTISSMPMGIDPEEPFNTSNTYPILATYTFGVALEF